MVNETLHSQLTIGHSQLTIKSRLAPHTDTPSLDAQVLLAHITGRPRAWLLAHPEALLNPDETHCLKQALQQLETGLPFPYVLGEWEFFGLKFKVTPDVLIPRPETELLVETALKRLKEFPGDERLYAADIGTGSGCIAISLAVNCPNLRIVATDISPAALAIARENTQAHRVADRINFIQADLLDSHLHDFHLIAANLPYIPTSTLHTLDVYGREPTLALDGGPDGLTLIQRLLSQAATHLTPGGLILLEIEATQGTTAINLARQHFPAADIYLYPDLAGHDRLLSIQTQAIGC